MIRREPDPASFLQQPPTALLLDLRSSPKYKRHHIPGARSVLQAASPASDFRLALDNLLLQQPNATEIRCYCATGGARSESFVQACQTKGVDAVYLDGGYPAFLQYVSQALARPLPLIVVGGEAGSGKTAILEALESAGAQVISLERMANHAGSAFGSLRGQKQPSHAQFHNLLGLRCARLNSSRPVWIEQETRHLGAVGIPALLWEQIDRAPMVRVRVPKSRRVARLLEQYQHYTRAELTSAIRSIRPRLGPANCENAVQATERGDLQACVTLLLQYYDTAYEYQIRTSKRSRVIELEVRNEDVSVTAGELVAMAAELLPLAQMA